MAEPVTVDQLKVHLRLGSTVTAEDAYLAGLITAARRKVEIDTRRSFSGDDPTLAGDDAVLAGQAIVVIAGYWYDHRDATDMLPPQVGWMIDDLCAWDTGADDVEVTA